MKQNLTFVLFAHMNWDSFIRGLTFSVKTGKIKIATEMILQISGLSIFLLLAHTLSDPLPLTVSTAYIVIIVNLTKLCS